MTKKYDYLVFIGRFQPLHNGHIAVMRQALSLSENVIVLVGSAYASRSPRNPFTFDERKQMIESVFHYETAGERRLHICPVRDNKSNDRWLASTHRQVKRIVDAKGWTDFPPRIGLIGFGKDESSFYLSMFPEWASENVDAQFGLFDSTAIRRQFFTRAPFINTSILPPSVAKWLTDFMMTSEFKSVVSYVEDIDLYKQSWAQSPFPPVFITVDNVVVHNGKILLIERKDEPGRGLLALPGGFFMPRKGLKMSAVTELKEETKIADKYGEIPAGRLSGFITGPAVVYDDFHRSERGPTVTHVFQYALPPGAYKVKGGDDAAKAKWWNIADLKSEMFFDDHFQILEDLNVVGADD